MEIDFIRNATLIIRSGEHQILLDPMLAGVGQLPAFSVFRHKRRRNPTAPLPPNMRTRLRSVTAGLITHCKYGHMDHLDRAGARFLAKQRIPTYCRPADEKHLKRRGIDARPLSLKERTPFLDGHITQIPARHGHGWIATLMGPGVGYFIEQPGEPSVYIAGDTVLTDRVRDALTRLKPDIAIVAAGNASMDLGEPILMSLEEVMEFARLAPGRVIANHLEALNHCPITREELSEAAHAAGLQDKIEIPHDGQSIKFEKKRKFSVVD